MVFFLGIISWKGASLFNGRVVFHLWSFMFKCGGTPWGISVLMGGGGRMLPLFNDLFSKFPLVFNHLPFSKNIQTIDQKFRHVHGPGHPQDTQTNGKAIFLRLTLCFPIAYMQPGLNSIILDFHAQKGSLILHCKIFDGYNVTCGPDITHFAKSQ